MSRSFKKFSIYTDYSRNYTKYAKRRANKAVRRYSRIITNGKFYRKIFNSWNIRDYIGRCYPGDCCYKKGLRK